MANVHWCRTSDGFLTVFHCRDTFVKRSQMTDSFQKVSYSWLIRLVWCSCRVCCFRKPVLWASPMRGDQLCHVFHLFQEWTHNLLHLIGVTWSTYCLDKEGLTTMRFFYILTHGIMIYLLPFVVVACSFHIREYINKPCSVIGLAATIVLILFDI